MLEKKFKMLYYFLKLCFRELEKIIRVLVLIFNVFSFCVLVYVDFLESNL